MKAFSVLIAAMLSVLSLVHLADAGCIRCPRKARKVKVVRVNKVKVVPLTVTTYSPQVAGPTVIVPPPVIQVAGPTIVQPPSVRIGGPTVSLPAPATTIYPKQYKVIPPKVMPTVPLQETGPCAEYIALLQKMKLAVDQCEVRERALLTRMAEYEKRLGLTKPKEEPKNNGDDNNQDQKPKAKAKTFDELKASAKLFVTNKCLACHGADKAFLRGGPNKYVLDFDKMTRNQALYCSGKINSGDMPNLELAKKLKLDIKAATEQEAVDFEDYANKIK